MARVGFGRRMRGNHASLKRDEWIVLPGRGCDVGRASNEVRRPKSSCTWLTREGDHFAGSKSAPWRASARSDLQECGMNPVGQSAGHQINDPHDGVFTALWESLSKQSPRYRGRSLAQNRKHDGLTFEEPIPPPVHRCERRASPVQEALQAIVARSGISSDRKREPDLPATGSRA